jgi:pre-rRNA-processing protein TSR4
MKQMKITSPSNPSAFGFGLANQIFNDISSPPSEHPSAQDDAGDDDPSDTESDSISSEKSLLTAMASATLGDSEWKSAPSYPPLYLSTASEYLPPQPKPKLPQGAHVTDPAEDDGKGNKDMSWVSEAYEDSLEMDHVFERFMKRVGYEGEQCVRSVTRYLHPNSQF